MSVLSRLRRRQDSMLDELEVLVRCESPSDDLAALSRCADLVDTLGTQALGGPAERLVDDGRIHLRWHSPGHRGGVLLLGHLDTVWPVGTLKRLPFQLGDRGGCRSATGPGCFDMKAGLVQMFHALAMLDDLTGVTVLVNSDEEIGSPSARRWIEAAAEGAEAVLVLEPSAGGALKTARKGTSRYRVSIQGRAAHAGLEPERGANAAIELAHQVLAIRALQRPEHGRTVTPTVLDARTAPNTVPANGAIEVDVRCATVDDQRAVDREMRQLRPWCDGTTIQVDGGARRPPLEPGGAGGLIAVYRRVVDRMGLPAARTVSVGGASDGNLTAALGVPTLDGLGAVGGGAHSDDEWVAVDAMPERAAIVYGLVSELRTR